MSDLIDRRMAIGVLNGCTESKGRIRFDDAVKGIKKLPPAQPEQLGTNLAEVGTDCISRQALLDKFEPWLKVKDYNDGELNMLKAVLYEIRFMRPAQPERIIHCKDCEWWTKQECSPQGRCALSGMYPTGGWFCGNARMREVTE